MAGPINPHQAPKYERYLLDDFTGGLKEETIYSKVQIQDNECVSADNIEYWPIGTVSKRPGWSYMHAANGAVAGSNNCCLSASIEHLYEHVSSTGSTFFLVFTAASAASESGEVAVFTSTGYTTGTFTPILSTVKDARWKPSYGDVFSCVSFGGSAIFANSRDEMYAWNSTVSEQASCMATAPSAVTFLTVFKNHLFAGDMTSTVDSADQGSRIQWSDPGDAHTWPAANYIDLDKADGSRLMGMAVLGNELIVFKENAIYAVTYVGGIYGFDAERRVQGIGCTAKRSVLSQGGKVYFYGTGGVFYSFDGRTVTDLSSDKIQDMATDINANYLARMCVGHHQTKDQIWWLAPYGSDAIQCNKGYIYTKKLNNWTIFTYTCSATCLAQAKLTSDVTFASFSNLNTKYDDVWDTWGGKSAQANATYLVAGSNPNTTTARLVAIDAQGREMYKDNDGAYSGVWLSRWLTFNMPDINKRIVRITWLIDRKVSSSSEAYYIDVDLYTDWDNTTATYSKTLNVYGTKATLELRNDLTFQCRSLQIKISTDAASEPFTVHGIVIEYIPKGRTKV